MCCQLCFYLNIHKGHKVIFFNNKELFEKEDTNTDINLFKNLLNESVEEIIKIKNLIETENDKIDNRYDSNFNEILKYFKENPDKKIKEEELIDKLKFEVTKIKEKFEFFLTDCNVYIKNGEMFNKIIKLLNKEEEKNNLIKKLLYISKINDNIENMDNLKRVLMKNIDIKFIKKDLSIEFEEYYFNGIQIPKDVEIKDINSNYFKLFWIIDDINIINFEKKNLKYIVELRKNTEEKFVKFYEGEHKTCLITNLNKNTNYEIRICCGYKNIYGPWTKIYEIKTSDILYKIPINPKVIKMKFNGYECVFISHRWHSNDRYSYNKTKLAIHKKYFESDRTPVKWLFIPDENNYVTIRYDIDNIYHMLNWEIYSDENEILLCENLSSKFEIIMLNKTQFYIRDIKSGKYLYNSKNMRDDDSYFIELGYLNENEKERYIFYI